MHMRAFGLLGALFGVSQSVLTLQSDPAQDLARVRLIVVTRAATADVTVSGATIASYVSSVLAGSPPARSSQTGHTLRLSRNIAGEIAEARFDLVLAGVSSGRSVTWNLATSSNSETQIEVYALNQLDRPRLVDRFASADLNAQFVTPAAHLDSHGTIRVAPIPRLVLANFYPWYTSETWSDPQLADRPLRPYSTDEQADVNTLAREAHAAGIDAFVVSWHGKEAGNPLSDRRMRIMLEAARLSALEACVSVETLVANRGYDPGAATDPEVMFEWLADIVDRYGSHGAYLRLGNRPVVFVYAAWRLQQAEWADLIARLRASGRQPLLMGDFFHSPLLEVFDGEYQYTNVALSAEEILDLDRTESLRVRTYHLLRPDSRRRIWIATVTPGYDDTRLTSRESHFYVDRSNGRVYDDQWRAAINTAADWVIVTSWNEWWENTQIEPSARYGTTFLDRTRSWANVFKRQGAP